GVIDDVGLHDRVLSPDEVEALATTDAISDIVALPLAKRTPQQSRKLRMYFLQKHAPKAIQEAHAEVVTLERQREQLVESLPTTMVMEEMGTPREAFVLVRGQYDKHGEKVM